MLLSAMEIILYIYIYKYNSKKAPSCTNSTWYYSQENSSNSLLGALIAEGPRDIMLTVEYTSSIIYR